MAANFMVCPAMGGDAVLYLRSARKAVKTDELGETEQFYCAFLLGGYRENLTECST